MAPARVQGWRDTRLNRRGREQAHALARRAAGEGVSALWTSHLTRAYETAQIVARELDLKSRIDPRFAESRRGDWEGRLVAEVKREDPPLWDAWLCAGGDFTFPGGESLAEHQRRVLAGLADVAAGELPALVVSHGGTIRCALAALHPAGLKGFHSFEVPNAALIRIPHRVE